MPQPDKRSALQVLTKARLRELVDAFELKLAAAESKDAHVELLSATPHNGHSNSFSALLEILDPDRFCRGVPPDDHLLTEVMVRRLKSDLRELSPGDFPERRVVPEVIDGLHA